MNTESPATSSNPVPVSVRMLGLGTRMLPSSFSNAMNTRSRVSCPSGSVTLAWNGIVKVVEPVGISTEAGLLTQIIWGGELAIPSMVRVA